MRDHASKELEHERAVHQLTDLEVDLHFPISAQPPCADVAKSFDPADEYRGLKTIRILDICPVDSSAAGQEVILKVADYANNALFLDSRLAAVRIIDKWAGANLDPFDTDTIQRWADNRRPQQPKL